MCNFVIDSVKQLFPEESLTVIKKIKSATGYNKHQEENENNIFVSYTLIIVFNFGTRTVSYLQKMNTCAVPSKQKNVFLPHLNNFIGGCSFTVVIEIIIDL